MQKLNIKIMEIARMDKMQKLEKELAGSFSDCRDRDSVECPFCHYISTNKRFSAKVFINDGKKILKCFACGEWRFFK